jgi:DNA-binding CsgD family transcriptional regulator
MNHDFQGSRNLKPRDERIIELVSRGLRNEDIAREIGTTEHVVKNYLKEIYDKLGVWNRLELALWHVARSSEPHLMPPAPVAKLAFDPVDPFALPKHPRHETFDLPQKTRRLGLSGRA